MNHANILPCDLTSLGVLGYAVTVTKQVHSYQLLLLDEYLRPFNLSINDTVLAAILDGTEAAIPFPAALEAFSKEEPTVQTSLLSLAIQLSSIDSRVDAAEETLLSRLIKASSLDEGLVEDLRFEAYDVALAMRNENNQLFKPPFTPKKKKATLWQKIVNFFRAIFGKKVPKKQEESESYTTAIARCAEVAKDDFSIVCPAYNEVLATCTRSIEDLTGITSGMASKNEISIEVGKLIAEFAKKLSAITEIHSEAAKEAFIQKERTLPDFTISLIGRTKAGKSTLHSILTNEGRDKIGVGLQRTTRYNRVYQWNLLRLIDTPGIGSAEADGRTDDQIAESVLGESDIICCVIVDDSIQQDVLEFIEKIAALGKPVVILLNHKENLNTQKRLDDYLAHPRHWLETKGEDNLQGHINRIMRYAATRQFEHQITVFPVYLLPAFLAGDEKYEEYKETLWNGSNIDLFIEKLKTWITEAGPLKRSQTLLDETIHSFERASTDIHAGRTMLAEKCAALKAKKPNALTKLRTVQAEILEEIEKNLRYGYTELIERHGLTFAEEHYKEKGDLTEAWSDYMKEIRFAETLQESIKPHVDRFAETAQEEVQEVLDDFYYSLNTAMEVGGIEQPIQIDFKSITKILGGLFDLGGSVALVALGMSNPIGWVLTGVGVVIGLISKLFKSQAQKQQEAIDKLHQAIKNGIGETSEKNITDCLNDIRLSTDQAIDNIDRLFTELIAGLERTERIADGLMRTYQAQVYHLNQVYAWRILQHLSKEHEPFSAEQASTVIKRVDRVGGKDLRIITKKAVKGDPSSLAGILAEKVSIVTEEVK